MHNILKQSFYSRTVWTFLCVVVILFCFKIVMVILILSKNLNFNNHFSTDHNVDKFTISLVSLFNNSNLPQEKLSHIVSGIDMANTNLDGYEFTISLSEKTQCQHIDYRFYDIKSLYNHLDKNQYGFCIDYKLNQGWFTVRANPKFSLGFLVDLLNLFNVMTFIFIVIYVWILMKLILPLKKFQYHAVQVGMNLNHSPIEINSIDIINKTAQTLNFMQNKVLQTLNLRTRILANISHDILTPLTRIKLRLQTQDKPQKKKTIKDIEEIQAMLTRAMIYAKDNFLQHETKSRISLVSYLKKISSEYQEQTKRLKLVNHVKKVNLIVLARPISFKRALRNIIDNALKHATNVQIHIKKESSYSVLIQIIDNGLGIHPDNIKEIFKPFYKIDNNMSGMGLGLSIVYEIIKDMQGTIKVYNVPEGGLCVDIILPLK